MFCAPSIGALSIMNSQPRDPAAPRYANTLCIAALAQIPSAPSGPAFYTASSRERELGVGIDVVGFDSGEGMPGAVD